MGKAVKEQSIMLTVGSKYIVRSLEAKERPLTTVGTFKGYTAIAGDDAICIELDKKHDKLAGKIRIIPCHMILSIDVVSAVEPVKEKELNAETQRYFG